MNLGNLDITKLCVGAEEALSACIGTQVVWSASSGSPLSGVWIEDSLGNEYSGTLSYDFYAFNFQKRADATFTLYEDGQVVTASSYGYMLCADCEYDDAVIETDEDQDIPVEDIAYFTGYDSSTTVSVQLVYNLSDGSVSITMDVEDCDRYWDHKQDECEDEGRCWDGGLHDCLDCPTCQDEDLCGDYPDCHECPDCDDWENLGYESYEECTCLNYDECDDPCQEDPCECDQYPDECRCNETDGYHYWDGETCHSCEDEWEELGYASAEECACDHRGEMCE